MKFLSIFFLLFSLNVQATEKKNLLSLISEKHNFTGWRFSMKVTGNSGEMPTEGLAIIDDMGWMDDSVRGARYVYKFKSGEYDEKDGYLSNIKEITLTETWFKCSRGEKTWIRKGEGLCP